MLSRVRNWVRAMVEKFYKDRSGKLIPIETSKRRRVRRRNATSVEDMATTLAEQMIADRMAESVERERLLSQELGNLKETNRQLHAKADNLSSDLSQAKTELGRMRRQFDAGSVEERDTLDSLRDIVVKAYRDGLSVGAQCHEELWDGDEMNATIADLKASKYRRKLSKDRWLRDQIKRLFGNLKALDTAQAEESVEGAW